MFGGRYRVTRVLGSGAMGVVLAADDAQGPRAVALKVLAPHLAGSPVHRERFVRESMAARRVSHPNAVRVFEAGDDGASAWFAMELVEGPSLQERLARGRPPLRESLATLRCVADALEAARAAGVLHRDVKPGNVILPPGGAAKLVDFGIARVQGELTITAEGDVFGTPSYLAPEQCRGLRAEHASDLYALGVMAFECVTGRLPFQGSAVELIVHHARTPAPRAAAVGPGIPPELDALIDRLLAKEAAHRPRDAASVRDALDAILGALPPDASAPAPAVDPRPAAIRRALDSLRGEVRSRANGLAALERAFADADRALRAERATIKDLEFQIVELYKQLAELGVR